MRAVPAPLLVFAALAGAIRPAGTLAQEGTLVVVNKAAASASVIDVATGTTIAILPTGDGPHEVAISRDGRTAVVANYGAASAGNSLTVLDLNALAVERTISLGEYRRPHGIAFLPGDSLVAVTSEATGHVIFVRLIDGGIARALPTNGRVSHMLAVTDDARRIYTTNITDHTVSEIDVRAGLVARQFSVPRQPEAITVSGDGAEVWLGSNAEGQVSVITTATGQVRQAAAGFSFPYRVALTRRWALIPDFRSSELRLVDRQSFAERGRLALDGGPQGLALTPDGRFAFVSLSQANQVAQVDVEALRVMRTFRAGAAPDGIAWSPHSFR